MSIRQTLMKLAGRQAPTRRLRAQNPRQMVDRWRAGVRRRFGAAGRRVRG